MQDTRLIKILRTFSEDEFKDFGKFAGSPFFSKGRDLVPLYKALKKYYPEFDGNGMEKEKIFAKLGKGKYNDQLMRIMISDLYKLAVEYLKYVSQNSSQLRTNINLADEAIKRGLFFLAEQCINEADKLAESSGIDGNYFNDRFDIENKKTDYNFFSGETLYKGSAEETASDFGLFHYLMLAANHLHNMYSTKTNVNIDYSDYTLIHLLKNANLEKLEPLLEGSRDKNAARIYLYYILSHLNEKDEHYFYKLKELLFKHLHYFVQPEKGFMLNLYDSLCTKKIFDIDFDKYTAERLEAKKKMLSEGVFRREPPNFISPVKFYAFIITGIAAGDIKWVEMMLDKHIGDIAPEHRGSLSNYFKAEICYLKKDFEAALTYTGKVDLSVFFIKPTLFALQLKIYYELNYVDEALSIIDTFRHYIANNKQATTIVRNARSDFLKFYYKLLMYRSGKRQNTPAKIMQELEETSALHKKWLMEKLSELK